MTLKVTQGHRNCRYSIFHYHLQLMVYRNSDPIVHPHGSHVCVWHWQVIHFRKKQSKLQAICAFRFTRKHIVDHKYYIYRSMGVRKVSNSIDHLQGHSRLLVMVPFDMTHTIFNERELTFTFAICYRRSVCLSSDCNVGAPYSAG